MVLNRPFRGRNGWFKNRSVRKSFGWEIGYEKSTVSQLQSNLRSENILLDDVVSSILLGGADFIAFIKDNFLSGKKPDRDLPALKELVKKASTQDIFDEVESVFEKGAVLTRDVKMFLTHKYTSTKLKDIGLHFGIGESGVSQATRRMQDKIKREKKLRNKIKKINIKLHL